jgi:hypothetical protein
VVTVLTVRALKPRLRIQSMRRSGVPVKLWKVFAGPERVTASVQTSCKPPVSFACTGVSGAQLKSPVRMTRASAGSWSIQRRISAALDMRGRTSSSR